MLSSKQKFLFTILIIFIGTFFFIKPVNADLFGVFDYQQTVEDALDFIDQAILKFLTSLVILAFGSSAFVILSGYLLKWAYNLPLYLQNPLVLGGWHFVLGLVNLFFILAFVFIALAYILKIETFQLKKTLPRLIAIILLVNFSMLIVGLFVDVSQFFMNEFKGAFGATSSEKLDFVDKAVLPLKSTLGQVTSLILITLGTYIASAFVPFGAIVSLGLMATLLRKQLFQYIFSVAVLIGINLLTGAMFFIFALLFIARIVALWLLTIFAPLAFFAFIFPQTQKYFEKWIKMVIQWAFIGVIAFFLLGLITSLFAQVFTVEPPEISISGIPGVPAFELPPSIYNYLFLVIFLAVAFYATTKYVPVGADKVVGLAKAQIFPAGGKIAKGLIKKVAPPKTATREKFKGGLYKAGERLGLVKPGTYEARLSKKTSKLVKEYESYSPDALRKIAKSKRWDYQERAAAAIALAKKGEFKDFTEAEISKIIGHIQTAKGDITEIYKARPDLAPDPEEQIKKISPEDLRKKIQPEALEKPDIFTALSTEQIREIFRKGKAAQKEALTRAYFNYLQREHNLPLYNLYTAYRRRGVSESRAILDTILRELENIENRVATLGRIGEITEARKIADTGDHILRSLGALEE